MKAPWMARSLPYRALLLGVLAAAVLGSPYSADAAPTSAKAPGAPPAKAATASPNADSGSAKSSTGSGASAKAAQGVSRRTRASQSHGLGHIVKPGDTLWTIARRYGVSVEALARANDLSTRARLQVGRRLVIPGGAIQEGRQEPPSLAEIVLAPPPEPQPTVLAWPVSGPVASPFGPRGSSWHGGLDIRVDRGTPIRASAPGMVITSDTEAGYGHVVKVWHAFDLMTVYAHNQENFVKVGDWVERGQVVGLVGQSGRATAPHLHFEVRLDGKKYNPLYWLPPPGSVDVATSQTSSPTVGP